MRHCLFAIMGCVLWASSALAIDMPARKAGLWELKMSFDNGAIPVQTVKQCIDAATDRLMKSDFGGPSQQTCGEQTINRSGGTLIIDSVCKRGTAMVETRAVVTGSFDSAYTMEITSKGGPRMPGSTGEESHMTIAATWLGACASDQRPGDMIMSNGMKMNVLDMQKAMPRPPKLPPQ